MTTVKQQNSVSDDDIPVNVFHKRSQHWERVRTWRPRKINGRWYPPGVWVYRYFTLSPGGGFYVYGDEFDVLKSS